VHSTEYRLIKEVREWTAFDTTIYRAAYVYEVEIFLINISAVLPNLSY